jgi:hypothetical protein
MKKPKLNARNAKTLKLSDGKDEDFFWNDDVTGFGLRLRRSESGGLHRTWIAR